LALQRIAVVVPPADWLNGVLRAYHDLYRQALVALGFATIDVPLQTFLQPDAGRIADLLLELRAFRPQAAISLSVGAWLMSCRLPPGRDGWAPNLFTEVLDIPTICIWDHAPLDFAEELFAAVKAPSARAALQRELGHPRLIHWSRDSGQTRLTQDLGFLPAAKVIAEPTPTLPGFVPDDDAPAPREDVAFVGHLNHTPPPWPDPILAPLAQEIVEEILQTPGKTAWDILIAKTAPVPALDPDRTAFWRFAHRTIGYEAQPVLRLATLGGTGAPTTVYGNLDPARAAANLTSVRGHIPLGPPLARTFARHAITVDVASLSFIEGFGHKPVLGFAAGGFVLLNRKRDFVATFGDAGEAVSYSSVDELAARIDLYLTRPALRREIGQAIRETLFARHGLQETLTRVIERATGEIAARAPYRPPPTGPRSVPVFDLLPRLRRWGEPPQRWWHPDRWRRSATVSCEDKDWGYAASAPLPAEVTRLKEPHLLVTVATEAGRLGVGLLRNPHAPPFVEHFVSPSRAPVELTLELPPDASVQPLLRKTSDEPMRARVTRLLLCDRR